MKVTGADIEPEAISYAEKNYPGPAYIRKAAEEIEGQYDAIVTFETLEHIYYPGSILKAIQAPLVIASVPNEERYKFLPKAFEGDKYPHLRHYTPTEFEQLLNGSGLMVVERFCQKDKHGDVEPGTDGVSLRADGRSHEDQWRGGIVRPQAQRIVELRDRRRCAAAHPIRREHRRSVVERY